MTDIVNVGASANDGTGDALRAAFVAINQRFLQTEGLMLVNARYIGALSANPTTRYDGTALQTGDYYVNTTTNRFRVYLTGAWVEVEDVDASAAADAAAASALDAASDAAIANAAASIAESIALFTTNRNAVRLATTGPLAAHTYDNGAGTITITATGVLSVDGQAVALNDDLAVQFENTNPERNGIYRCTTAGASGVAAVLTRRTTEDTSAELGGACVTVTAGTVYEGWTLKVQQESEEITMGTTPITFARQTQAGAINSTVGPNAAMTNVGYDTFTQRGVCSFLATASSGYKYIRQALSSTVLNGGKVTVFYQADFGASAASPRVQLFRVGVGVVSNQAPLTLDGQLRSAVLTANNALNATGIAFESNGVAAAYGVRYVVIPGDLSETVPSRTPLVATLMSMADLMSQPQKDMTLRSTGLVTGPSANTSMDTLAVNGLGDLSFTESSGSISYARTTIGAVASGTKATLVYRVLPIDGALPVTGAVRAQLEELGFGNASSTVTLIADGQPRSIAFTATRNANRILWDAATANMRVIFLLLPGAVDDTTAQSTGLQAALLSLAQVVQAPIGGEYWTDDDELIFWPTPVAFVTGRDATIYGRQVVKRRQRQFNLDVSLISTAAEASNLEGFSRYATPELRFKPETLAGSSCLFEVRDPLQPTLVRRRAFTRYLANASQTGTVLFCMLGDSTAALALNALKNRVNASGATFQGVGTLTSSGINYEGRAGWSALNYLGKSRPAANPFLRALSVGVPAELAVIVANPTICFADDVSYGTGVRPSYAEDSSKASYSIFDWDYWRQNVAVGLTGAEKLRVCVQLGRNGTSSATFVADNELAHVRIVENFRATFPNGSIFVASEALGEATDTANSMPVVTGYRDRTAPIIQMKLKNFSGREADRVWVIPAWAMQNAFAGFVVNSASATNTDTGTTTHTVQDVVHYGGQTAIQWAEAVLGPLLYVHQTA